MVCRRLWIAPRLFNPGMALASSAQGGGMAPSLARALTASTLPALATSALPALATSEHLAVCRQNAGALASASRLLGAANTRARTFTRIAFIQDMEDMEEEEEEEVVMAGEREVRAKTEVKVEEVMEGRRSVVELMVQQGGGAALQ